MKRKYILAAAALAVLCAGVAAYSMNQNTELPSSTPNSSSTVSSIASSEPESGSTSVTDNRDIAKAENFITYQVSKEETATGTETHPEDQVNVSDEQLTEGQQKTKDIYIQACLDAGLTPEEAEARWQEKRAEGSAKNEEAEQKREELADLRQQELEDYEAARDAWYRENYGISSEEFAKLSPSEKADLVLAHPEVDRSTNPESSWDWQYQ